jgi:quercetin dioxygenase-like cupin family protein
MGTLCAELDKAEDGHDRKAAVMALIVELSRSSRPPRAASPTRSNKSNRRPWSRQRALSIVEILVGSLPRMTGLPSTGHPLVSEIVLDVRLPWTSPIDRIEVRRIRMLSGHAAGLHVHNGPVVGSIVEGSVIYQVEGEPQSLLGPGEVFYEPEGARIARFDAGDDGATFLAYFPLTAGKEPAVELPDN